MAGEGLRWSLSVDSANNVRAPKPSNRAGDMIRGREGTQCTVSHIARGHFILLLLPWKCRKYQSSSTGEDGLKKREKTMDITGEKTDVRLQFFL